MSAVYYDPWSSFNLEALEMIPGLMMLYEYMLGGGWSEWYGTLTEEIAVCFLFEMNTFRCFLFL